MDPYLPTMLVTNITTNFILSLSIVLLLCCSAFFSCSETAFTTVSGLRLRSLAESKVKGARKAVYISENYQKALTTILVGNNLVNIACTTICAYLFTSLIKNPTLANVLNTVIMTIIVLIFGEIMPKAIAKMNSEKIALKFSGVLFFLIKVLTPITFLFLKMQNKMVKVKVEDATPTVTEDELESIIDTMQEEGVIDSDDADLIQGVLDLNQNTAYDIMIPRVDVKAVSIDTSIDELEQVFKETQFTRLPVYKDTIDNIVGIISQKDLFFALVDGKTMNIASLMSEPLNITEIMKVDDIIKEMQKTKKHMAIVLDEHGGTSGIVTLEDAMEQIVGEIYDEHDKEEKDNIIKIDDFNYKVSPDTEISELFEYLNIEHLPETQYSKVDGFIFEQLGDVPSQGDTYNYIAFDDILQDDASIVQRKVELSFKLVKVEDNRIREILLHVEPLEEEKDSL